VSRRIYNARTRRINSSSSNSSIPNEGPPILRALSSLPFFSFFIVLALLVLAGNALWTYSRVNSCALFSTKIITVNGSTAFAPLVQDVANEYQQKCFEPTIQVNAGKLLQGSSNGIQQVEQGAIDVGTSDVFADPNQNGDLQDYQVAIVVFAVVVNDSVDVNNLTTDQIRRIYSGDISNWNQTGGKNSQDVVRVSRPPSSGTRQTFEKYVLGGVETVSGPQSLVTDTSDTVAKSVKMQPGAIGYVSLYYAKKYDLKVISIDGKSPESSSLVRDDSYRFWNIEHMYMKASAEDSVKAFVHHMFSDAAKQIISNDAYLNLASFTSAVLAHHITQN
jgi:phosphate transport system substrate-binding protein